jgi:hypothetical protein
MDLLAEGRHLAVFHAFIDESGTNPETPVLSVAGVYGTGNQWRKFRKAWKPFAEEFHAKDRSSRFPEMCHAIELARLNGMLITVGKEAYKQSAGNHLKTVIGDPYAACALMCAAKICEEISYRKISFVLEQGRPNLGFVKDRLEEMIDSSQWGVAAVSSARKDAFIELHTADFISHIASSHDTTWMGRLFQSGRLKHGHMTEELIKQASPQVKAMILRARYDRKTARKG